MSIEFVFNTCPALYYTTIYKKYKKIKKNDNYNGLITFPINPPIGFNHILLNYIRYRHNNFPHHVMYIINEYLNWIPIEINIDNKCECGNIISTNNYLRYYCSWDCKEKIERKQIIDDEEKDFSNILYEENYIIFSNMYPEEFNYYYGQFERVISTNSILSNSDDSFIYYTDDEF